jgi:UDP-N-acetylglucosamine--N-acetylmuramyl-(pentapeptide) pyrophosphoryl-undecaprenol N-acetylglucosamine transferase
MKILLTGAHFTPAQAVIEKLKKDSSVEIVYVGRKYTRDGDSTLSVEYDVLKKENIKFYSLIAGRIKRYFSLGTIISLFKIPIGFIQAFYIVTKEQPSIVVSFGGYIGVPVVFASWLLSIPIIIHEQTMVAGLANQVSSWFASKVAILSVRADF